MLQRQLSGSPAGEVLSVMQRRGNVTIKDLEEALNVTANAVRQQLTVLLSEGSDRASRLRTSAAGGPSTFIRPDGQRAGRCFPTIMTSSLTRCCAKSW